MKKVLFLLLASFLVLAACGNEESKSEGKKETKSVDKESKKEDKNKKQAVEIDFIKFNNSEYEHEQSLKITEGTVKSIGENDLGTQTALIQRKEDEGYVSYHIVNYSDKDIKENQNYTFYGTNDLKNNEGHPTIDVTSFD